MPVVQVLADPALRLVRLAALEESGPSSTFLVSYLRATSIYTVSRPSDITLWEYRADLPPSGLRE